MVQPRYKQYTNNDRKKKEERRSSGRKFGRGCTLILVLIVVVTGCAIVLQQMPMRTSTSGEYTRPDSRNNIGQYSLARWFLHDAHANQFATDLAWYHRSKLSPAQRVSELDAEGFRPFLFLDEKDTGINILDAWDDPVSKADPFMMALLQTRGTGAGFISRRSLTNTNIFGDTWMDVDEEQISVNPQEDTSLHAQFLPVTPQFIEEYVCYLAQVWETAAADYIELYQRPPGNLEDLLNGVGLAPNPDCVWPFEERDRSGVNFEGGVIDGNIIFWRVTLIGGATRGQARYWDQYTTYDDPDTPINIITQSMTSTVVDPGLVKGPVRVLLDLDTVKALLDSVRPVEEEEASD